MESAKRYQIAFRNCSTLAEQMMLRQSFYNYVLEGFSRGGYLNESRRPYPTALSKAIHRWIANNETLDPARFPNGYDPSNPPNWPLDPMGWQQPGGGWEDWIPGSGPGFQPHPNNPNPFPQHHKGDPGPFWRGWEHGGWGTPENPMHNPWHWDNGEWRYIEIPGPKPGSPPPGSVDLPEMLRHRYIQILNEKLKRM